MYKLVCFLVLAIAGFGLNKAAQADLVIDNYSNGSPLVQFGAGTITRTTIGGGIFGGERAESLTVRNLGGLGFFGIAGFGANGVSVGQSVQDQIYGSFSYSNFSPTDFTIDGFNRFRLRFSSSNSATPVPGVISITVTSGASTSTAYTIQPASTGLPNSSYVFFNQFSGVDFTNVDSVTFGFDFAGNPGRAFAMTGFALTAIPEPASFTVAIMLIGGTCFRRKRRTAKRVA